MRSVREGFFSSCAFAPSSGLTVIVHNEGVWTMVVLMFEVDTCAFASES